MMLFAVSTAVSLLTPLRGGSFFSSSSSLYHRLSSVVCGEREILYSGSVDVVVVLVLSWVVNYALMVMAKVAGEWRASEGNVCGGNGVKSAANEQLVVSYRDDWDSVGNELFSGAETRTVAAR
jgi:hypothetical protein